MGVLENFNKNNSNFNFFFFFENIVFLNPKQPSRQMF